LRVGSEARCAAWSRLFLRSAAGGQGRQRGVRPAGGASIRRSIRSSAGRQPGRGSGRERGGAVWLTRPGIPHVWADSRRTAEGCRGRCSPRSSGRSRGAADRVRAAWRSPGPAHQDLAATASAAGARAPAAQKARAGGDGRIAAAAPAGPAKRIPATARASKARIANHSARARTGWSDARGSGGSSLRGRRVGVEPVSTRPHPTAEVAPVDRAVAIRLARHVAPATAPVAIPRPPNRAGDGLAQRGAARQRRHCVQGRRRPQRRRWDVTRRDRTGRRRQPGARAKRGAFDRRCPI
jgi:hypothetical protein